MHTCVLKFELLSKMKLCSYNVGRSRVDLARWGLIGKIHLTSGMDERETEAEIRSAFSTDMNAISILCLDSQGRRCARQLRKGAMYMLVVDKPLADGKVDEDLEQSKYVSNPNNRIPF